MISVLFGNRGQFLCGALGLLAFKSKRFLNCDFKRLSIREPLFIQYHHSLAIHYDDPGNRLDVKSPAALEVGL
jgi:hypothetical protein